MEKLIKIQEAIGSVKKDSVNPFLHNKYVDINSLLEQLEPVLKQVKARIFQPLTSVASRPALKTMLVDTENNKVIYEDTVTLPDLQDSQKMGGAVTYYRRYSILSLLGLGAEDDDGNTASGRSDTKEKASYTKVADAKAYQAKNKANMEEGIDPF